MGEKFAIKGGRKLRGTVYVMYWDGRITLLISKKNKRRELNKY